jgi:hypothetical protein
MKIFKIAIFILCFCSIVFPQNNSGINSKIDQDLRVNQNKPSVYITLEKCVNNSENSNQLVLLRLQNNTRWQISLRGNSEDKNTNIFDVPYIVRIPLNQESDSLFVGKRQNKLGVIWRIESGKSLLFDVKKEHIAEGKLIMVNFSFEWESAGLSGGDNSIFHQALFRLNDLTKNECMDD